MEGHKTRGINQLKVTKPGENKQRSNQLNKHQTREKIIIQSCGNYTFHLNKYQGHTLRKMFNRTNEGYKKSLEMRNSTCF